MPLSTGHGHCASQPLIALSRQVLSLPTPTFRLAPRPPSPEVRTPRHLRTHALRYLSHVLDKGEQRPIEQHAEVELMLEVFATPLEDLLYTDHT